MLSVLSFNFFIGSRHLLINSKSKNKKGHTHAHSCDYQTCRAPAREIKEGKPRELGKADFYRCKESPLLLIKFYSGQWEFILLFLMQYCSQWLHIITLGVCD